MSDWYSKTTEGLLECLSLDKLIVRVYTDRLAVWRKDGQRMTWEELQSVKEQVWGDLVAVEVYPAARDVVNLRHTRHLWYTPELADRVKADCQHAEFNNTTGE